MASRGRSRNQVSMRQGEVSLRPTICLKQPDAVHREAKNRDVKNL